MKRKPMKNKDVFNTSVFEMSILEGGRKICKHSAPIKSVIPVNKDIMTINFNDIKNKNMVLVDKETFDFLNNKR